MEELNVIKLKLYKEEFTKEVDPYKVVKCTMDCFSPYSYICHVEFKKHYPDLYNTFRELEDELWDELGEFEDDWLREIQG